MNRLLHLGDTNVRVPARLSDARHIMLAMYGIHSVKYMHSIEATHSHAAHLLYSARVREGT